MVATQVRQTIICHLLTKLLAKSFWDSRWDSESVPTDKHPKPSKSASSRSKKNNFSNNCAAARPSQRKSQYLWGKDLMLTWQFRVANSQTELVNRPSRFKFRTSFRPGTRLCFNLTHPCTSSSTKARLCPRFLWFQRRRKSELCLAILQLLSSKKPPLVNRIDNKTRALANWS